MHHNHHQPTNAGQKFNLLRYANMHYLMLRTRVLHGYFSILFYARPTTTKNIKLWVKTKSLPSRPPRRKSSLGFLKYLFVRYDEILLSTHEHCLHNLSVVRCEASAYDQNTVECVYYRVLAYGDDGMSVFVRTICVCLCCRNACGCGYLLSYWLQQLLSGNICLLVLYVAFCCAPIMLFICSSYICINNDVDNEYVVCVWERGFHPSPIVITQHTHTRWRPPNMVLMCCLTCSFHIFRKCWIANSYIQLLMLELSGACKHFATRSVPAQALECQWQCVAVVVVCVCVCGFATRKSSTSAVVLKIPFLFSFTSFLSQKLCRS